MQVKQDTTIAQFVFDHDPALDLPVLVNELDQALQKSGAGQRRITWDCDDLALIDVDDARFALSYADAETGTGAPQRSLTSLVPLNASEPALIGPATISIHDDGYVLRNRTGRERRDCCAGLLNRD